MAKYLLLIHGDEQTWATMSEQEQQQVMDGHAAFTAAAGTALLGGEALEPSPTAKSLRRGSPGGRPHVTDGPFLETKEALGGFYLLEAADLDEAISLASLLPEVAGEHSGAEVRPVTSY